MEQIHERSNVARHGVVEGTLQVVRFHHAPRLYRQTQGCFWLDTTSGSLGEEGADCRTRPGATCCRSGSAGGYSVLPVQVGPGASVFWRCYVKFKGDRQRSDASAAGVLHGVATAVDTPTTPDLAERLDTEGPHRVGRADEEHVEVGHVGDGSNQVVPEGGIGAATGLGVEDGVLEVCGSAPITPSW